MFGREERGTMGWSTPEEDIRATRSVETTPTDLMTRFGRVPMKAWIDREYVRFTLVLFALPPTLWLTWLVLHREPLPFADMGTAALVTVIYCGLVIVALLSAHGLPLLSFPSLFLGVTFLFTCSPLILYELQGTNAFRLWEWVDTPSVLVAMPVVMLAFSSFLVGALLLPTRVTNVRMVASGTGLTVEARVLRKVGFAIYVISVMLIVASTLTGNALTYAFEGGYGAYHGAKRAGQFTQFIGVSMAHLLPWSLLIMAATSRDRRSRVRVVLLSLPFLVIMLAVGDRGGPIATMAVITSGLYLVGARIGWLRSLVVVALIAFLIPTILNLRQLPISQLSRTAIANAATNQVEATHTFREGPIEGFLVSMSSSYQTLMATVMVVPQEEGFHYGSDYFSSLIVAVPFRSVLLSSLGDQIQRLPPSQWVLLVLHPGRNAGPGYLQVAEAYLEFGAIGVVGLYLILGWGLTRLWRLMSTRAADPRVLAFTLIVMMETLLWVRNSSSLLVRALAWGWLLVYVVPAMLARRKRSARPRRAERTAMLYQRADG